MTKYLYYIVDQDGGELIEILSTFTILSQDEYFTQYIVPLLSSIAKSYGVKKALWLDYKE